MSTNKISLSQAHSNWQDLIAEAGMDRHDHPAMAESWNNYVDALEKDGHLYPLQAQHAPAWDEQMPGEGRRFDPLADDRTHVLESMWFDIECVFVPWSQSRNAGSNDRSLNWKVTVFRDGKRVLGPFDYQKGCGHCPAYKNPPRFKSGKLDTYTRDALIKLECETGRRCEPLSYGSPHIRQTSSIAPPDINDVFCALLSDSSVLQCRDFAEWADELGFDNDSIKAKEAYDACLRQSLELHAVLGSARLDALRDLFEDM